ncbi:MAG TPA: hypothetical protein VGI00_17395 [Streptosporangiaceae bacterium]
MALLVARSTVLLIQRLPHAELAGHLAGQLGVAERTYDGVGYTLNQENR